MIALRTLSQFAVGLSVALSTMSLGGCGSDGEPTARAADAGPGPGTDPTRRAPEDGAASKAATAKNGSIANGRHAVFGLRMPAGTIPDGTPAPGVYRFEGPHSAAQVEAFLTAQLASFDPAVAEPSARLLRNATVRNPVGGAAAGPLAVRVHQKPGGSAVDVWLEQKTEGADATQVSTGTGMDAPGGGVAGAGAQKPTGVYATPAERRRAVFEMLQKVERGEPLSKEDLDNPLFQ